MVTRHLIGTDTDPLLFTDTGLEMRRVEMTGKIMDKTLDAVLGTRPICKSTPKPLAVDFEIKMTYKDSHGRSTEAFITVDIYGQICGQDISATRECPAEGRSIDGMRAMAWRINDGWGEEEVPLPDEIIEAIENDILETRGKCDGE